MNKYEKDLETKIEKYITDIEVYQEIVDDLVDTLNNTEQDLKAIVSNMDEIIGFFDKTILSENCGGLCATEHHVYGNLHSCTARIQYILDLVENKLDDYGLQNELTQD